MPSPTAPPCRPWIRRIWITGGYIDGIDLPLSPRSTVICGGPGTGKSTAVELLRYVLMLPVPERRREEIDNLVATNLGSGRAHVEYETAEGTVYEVSRAGGEREARVDAPRSAQGISAARLLAETLPVRFAGHGELERMATDGLARLDLLARFVWEEWDRLGGEIDRARRALDDNAAPLVRLEGEIAALTKTCAPLATQRARLAELAKESGGDPAPVEQAHRRAAMRERERLMVEGARRETEWASEQVAALAREAQARLAHAIDAEAAAGPNADVLADVARHVQRAGAVLEEMAARLAELRAAGATLLAERGAALAERHKGEDDAYRALLAVHETNAGRAFERLTLEKNVAELARAQSDLDARKAERDRLAEVRHERRARCRALVRQRRQLLEAAGKRIEESLDERVQIAIEPEAERAAYRALLGALTKGRRFEDEHLQAVAGAIGPDDLCAQVLLGDASVLEGVLGSKAVAVRLVSVLLDHPRRYALETVDVPDVPVIKLKHGDDYKPSNELSAGQRTVAFASILLLDKRGPLVADQPEDNVSNRYLAEYLCGVFAEVQQDAQLLFVTHNGNIPILGNVERLYELDSDGKRGWIASQGDPREVQEPMENNFEGGRGAFVKRKEFYGVE